MKKYCSLYFLSLFIMFFCSCSTNKTVSANQVTPPKIQDNQIDSTLLKLNISNNNIDEEINTSLLNDGLELLIDQNSEKINRLIAELSFLKENYIDLESKSKFWTDPIHLYSKKIILNNGTNIFGNITYQDEAVVHVETLIGTLSLARESIVRVVDYQVQNLEEELEIVDIIKNNPSAVSNNNILSQPVAEIVLSGEFSENQDANKNTILSGFVKNIGTKRADFIKINFTIYKDRTSTSIPKEYTVFIVGSSKEFENNIVSNSSLNPDEIGSFQLIIPSDFGPFISYSYSLDWEQYD